MVHVHAVAAQPVLQLREFGITYFPSWQEFATTILPLAYGII